MFLKDDPDFLIFFFQSFFVFVYYLFPSWLDISVTFQIHRFFKKLISNAVSFPFTLSFFRIMAEAGNGNCIPPILNSSYNRVKVKSPTRVWGEGMIEGGQGRNGRKLGNRKME